MSNDESAIGGVLPRAVVWSVGRCLRLISLPAGTTKASPGPRFRTAPDLLLSFQTHQGRLSERPMETDCKSVARATKVRILHLPPSATRGPDQRKRRSGPLACTREGYFALRIPKVLPQASDLRKRVRRMALRGIRGEIGPATWRLLLASCR